MSHGEGEGASSTEDRAGRPADGAPAGLRDTATIPSAAFTPGPDKDWRKAGRLADRARLWAERCIAETAYTYSYEPTTRRWDQARQRASDAEQKMLSAFSALTDLTAAKTRGERA